MPDLDWNAQIGQARSMHAAKPTRAQDAPPREACPAKLLNGDVCGRDVLPGYVLCGNHRGLDQAAQRVDGWLEKALNDLAGREPGDEQAQRLRDAIGAAVGQLARMPKRRVALLRAVGDVLMYAVTGQEPPAKADPMAKEWGNSGA